MNEFRARLKQARERAGLSARELSKAIGKGDSYINSIETGTRGHTLPPYDVIEKIAQKAAVEPGWLARGRGQAPEGPPRLEVVEVRRGGEVLQVPLREAVEYVENFPDPVEQERFRRWRRELDPRDYERRLARLYVAWASTLDVAPVDE